MSDNKDNVKDKNSYSFLDINDLSMLETKWNDKKVIPFCFFNHTYRPYTYVYPNVKIEEKENK